MQHPEFSLLDLDLKNEIKNVLSLAPDGVSEFSFSGLYLFRKRYQYKVSMAGEKALIISGIQPPHGPDEESQSFFMTPYGIPGRNILEELLHSHDYWKNIPDSILIPNQDRFNEWGIEITEDRDNFDYLYLRTDLAELKGKKFHKKRNLIAQFNSLYTGTAVPFTKEKLADAMVILEGWKEEKGMVGDYIAAREALESFDKLDLTGTVYYINDEPAAWCLGEAIAHNTIFTVHFEKGLEKFKGVYQYMNQAFAASLPEHIFQINREQDLGDEGLRHAKMSYRPSGFVRKHTGCFKSTSPGRG